MRQFVDEVGRVARGEASVRTTQPMGKPGRPKAELVQTLLGVRAGGAVPIAGTTPASAPVLAPAGMPLAPGAVAALKDAPAGATMQGVGSSPAIAPPPAGAPAADLSPERSPWAPPATAAAGELAATLVPAPAPASPSPSPVAEPQAMPIVAPVSQRAITQGTGPQSVAPPQVANAPAPSAGKGKDKGDSKGKFRETLWFKKGDLDAQAAVAAAEERAKTGKDTGGGPSDSLPMDERYKDDGSISRGDKEKYSLRTGSTQAMGALRDGPAQSSSKVSEDSLISEMKAGRGKILALIGLAVVVLIVIVVVVAT